MQILFGILASAVVLLLSGLVRAGESEPEIAYRGKMLYEAHCLVCHGPTGKGDGPSSHALIPPAPDFTDPVVKESLTKSRVTEAVANGRLTTQMEAWKNKLPAADIQEVMEYIQSFR